MSKNRKYSAYLITLAVVSAGLFTGSLTGEEYSGIIKVLLAVFVAGNVGEHFAEKKK